MTLSHVLKTGVCLSALMIGQSASADVTAQEVWDSWKSAFGIYGEDGLTIGSEEMSGDTLTVSGMILSMEEGDSSVSMDIADTMFTENGDGTVTITQGPNSSLSLTDEFGATVNMTISQTGFTMLASGEPDAISYDLSADQYVISVDEINDPSEDMSGDMRFALNALTGTYLVEQQENTQAITAAISAASMDMLADLKSSDGQDAMTMSGKIDGFVFDGSGVLPLDMDLDNPEEFMMNDFAISATYGVGETTFLADITDLGDQGTINGSVASSNVSIDFSAAGLAYAGAVKGLAMNMVVPDMPFPIDFSIAEYGFGIDVPLSKSDEPQDFGLNFNITEIAVNDEIWMMGDPMGQIPHDPITLKLDLAGTGKLLVDLMDPEQTAMVDRGEMMPGEIYSLDLNDLTISAAGAEVDGAGGFTFDNSDLSTIPGVPRPEGSVTVNINGANALIDSLVAMGLLPEDQAMMGRMMMGMFARTVGDDQLTSTIEINDQGHILANGQRIQ